MHSYQYASIRGIFGGGEGGLIGCLAACLIRMRRIIRPIRMIESMTLIPVNQLLIIERPQMQALLLNIGYSADKLKEFVAEILPAMCSMNGEIINVATTTAAFVEACYDEAEKVSFPGEDTEGIGLITP